MVDDNLTWKNHIDQLISKLNSACYAIRADNVTLSRKVLRMLYFSYVHSTIPCGIIFLGNTPNSIKIFTIKKSFKNYELGKENGFMQRTVLINGNFTSLCSIYIFSLNVCGEQQTFIYKKLRSP